MGNVVQFFIGFLTPPAQLLRALLRQTFGFALKLFIVWLIAFTAMRTVLG